MTRTTKHVVGAVLASMFVLGAAAGCDNVKGIGQKSGDKIKQGGDAGGSTGYP